MKIEFCKHNIIDEDIDEAVSAMKSLFITTGDKTKKFEDSFAQYTKTKQAIGLQSCTAGLFLILEAMNLPEKSKIITTPMTFAASSNVIIHAGHTPVFCEVEADTGNIDAEQLEKYIDKDVKAIIVVHLYGQMCDMIKIKQIADKYNLRIIEDCAHCVEGKRDDILPGELSEGCAYSFYSTKNITCGEGGAVTTNNDSLAERIKITRLHGMTRDAHDRYYSKTFKQYDIDFPGYKFNMTDIQAALLTNQLRRIEQTYERRHEIWKMYDEAFSGKIKRPVIKSSVKHALHLYTIMVDPDNRNNVIDSLFKEGVPVSVHYHPVHLFKYYRKTYGFKEGDFPIAEYIGKSTITLPFYPKLTNDEVEYIINKVLSVAF